ncbi:predicted protein [Postia placenta Mad-698-R]|nr:predicted protein [Postia placenta Mad-698-R]
MEYPHEPCVSSQLSIQQFVDRAQEVLANEDSDDAVSDFVWFALAGRDVSHAEQKRIFVNARQHVDTVLPHQYSIRRDYDSLIGITRSLPFNDTLYLYSFPPIREAMQPSDNPHVKFAMPMANGATLKVPLQRIPNIAFGKLSHRGQSRLFFPALWASGEHLWSITQATYAKFYDTILLPSIRHVSAVSAAHWPISYSSAMNHARDARGHYHYQTLDVNYTDLVELETQLLERMDQDATFKGAFWEHELRGTKDATGHEFEDVDAHRDRFESFISILNMDRVVPAEWCVDVAVEISIAGFNVAWLTTPALPFTHACYRVVDNAMWGKAFDNYFPVDPTARTGPTQNFGSVLYRSEWSVIVSQLGVDSRTTVRRELKRKFDDFIWIPYASDRIWATTPQRGKIWRQLPEGPRVCAPHLYVNPRFAHKHFTLRAASNEIGEDSDVDST